MNRLLILEYKRNFVIFIIVLTILLFSFLLIIRKTFSSYVVDTDLKIKVENALYIFNEGLFNFNIDLDAIVPSNDKYIYSFTVANYNDKKRSDVDISYTLSLITTTNLPLTYFLYRNDINSDNIITSDTVVSDEDSSWYHKIDISTEYFMSYKEDVLDTYYLVVDFPIKYSNSTDYVGSMENISIKIDSKQVIE